MSQHRSPYCLQIPVPTDMDRSASLKLASPAWRLGWWLRMEALLAGADPAAESATITTQFDLLWRVIGCSKATLSTLLTIPEPVEALDPPFLLNRDYAYRSTPQAHSPFPQHAARTGITCEVSLPESISPSLELPIALLLALPALDVRYWTLYVATLMLQVTQGPEGVSLPRHVLAGLLGISDRTLRRWLHAACPRQDGWDGPPLEAASAWLRQHLRFQQHQVAPQPSTIRLQARLPLDDLPSLPAPTLPHLAADHLAALCRCLVQREEELSSNRSSLGAQALPTISLSTVGIEQGEGKSRSSDIKGSKSHDPGQIKSGLSDIEGSKSHDPGQIKSGLSDIEGSKSHEEACLDSDIEGNKNYTKLTTTDTSEMGSDSFLNATDPETDTIWGWTCQIATLEHHTHLALTTLTPPTSREDALVRMGEVGIAVLGDQRYTLPHHQLLQRLDQGQALHLYPQLIHAAHSRAHVQRSHPGRIFGNVARQLIKTTTLPETLQGLVIGYNPATFAELSNGRVGLPDNLLADRPEAVLKEMAPPTASEEPATPLPDVPPLSEPEQFMRDFWRTILADLKPTLSHTAYHQFFHGSRIVNVQMRKPTHIHFTIAFPADWVATRLQHGRLGQRLCNTMASYLDGFTVTFEGLAESDKGTASHPQERSEGTAEHQPGHSGQGATAPHPKGAFREAETVAAHPAPLVDRPAEPTRPASPDTHPPEVEQDDPASAGRSTAPPLQHTPISEDLPKLWDTINADLKLCFPRAVWEQHFLGSQLVQLTPLAEAQTRAVIAFRSPASVEWFQRGPIGRRLRQILAQHLNTPVEAEYIQLQEQVIPPYAQARQHAGASQGIAR